MGGGSIVDGHGRGPALAILDGVNEGAGALDQVVGRLLGVQPRGQDEAVEPARAARDGGALGDGG